MQRTQVQIVGRRGASREMNRITDTSIVQNHNRTVVDMSRRHVGGWSVNREVNGITDTNSRLEGSNR